MQVFICFCMFIYLSTLSASEIRQESERIIKSKFGEDIILVFKKLDLEKDIKIEVEKESQQKFLLDYIYIWKISQNDSILGYTILDNVYGKSLPITFLVMFNNQKKILTAEVVKYRSPHGGAVCERYWLDQFIGMGADSKYEIGNNIDAISGATYSVNSLTRGIKKLALFIEIISSRDNFKSKFED